MKGQNRVVQALMASLSVVTGALAFILLVLGPQDALGLGVWVGLSSIGLLVLWVGDKVAETLHIKENSE